MNPAKRRTTIALTAEAYRIALAVSRERNMSLGEAVSCFIVGHALVDLTQEEQRSQKSQFPSFRCERTVTSEDVRDIENE